VVFVALLIAAGGPARAPDSLAFGDQWLDELRAPTRVYAHRIDDRAVKAEHSLEGWKSVEKLELEPRSAQLKALAELFAKGKLRTSQGPQLKCTFNADFALEFVARGGKRTAIFSFGCNHVQGDSGIRDFDLQDLGAFAEKLFPSYDVYQRVSRGERPYPDR
jgi:hypothetical protein